MMFEVTNVVQFISSNVGIGASFLFVYFLLLFFFFKFH